MNLPNAITLGRLLAVPLTISFILSGETEAAFFLFLAAGLSDAVDGYLAKRFDQRTEIGALLDPIADKALIVSVFFALGWTGLLPHWLVILVIFRDVLIVGGFILGRLLGAGAPSSPLAVSKVNTVCQVGLAALVLMRAGVGIGSIAVERVVLYAVAVTTVVSGAAYLARWLRLAASLEPGRHP